MKHKLNHTTCFWLLTCLYASDLSHVVSPEVFHGGRNCFTTQQRGSKVRRRSHVLLDQFNLSNTAVYWLTKHIHNITYSHIKIGYSCVNEADEILNKWQIEMNTNVKTVNMLVERLKGANQQSAQGSILSVINSLNCLYLILKGAADMWKWK